MNGYENHKTYDSYESSLASKIFIFQFVNSFNSLLIIAFVKRSINFMGGCVKTMQFGKVVSFYNYCDEELENQLVTIAIINFVKNATEIGVPWLLYKIKSARKKPTSQESEMNPIFILRKNIEKQNNLSDFNNGFIDETFNDYLELAIQFGFVNLFAMSFSLLPIIAWLTNIIEIQVDKTKLLRLAKRPNPISVSDIGDWLNIFDFLTFLSIFTNVAILTYTYNNYYEFSNYEKTTFFMALVFFYIMVKIIIAKLIPDVSEKTLQLQKRHNFVIEKMFNGVIQQEEPKTYFKVNLNVLTY
jgi:anoctamin-10